MKKAIVLGATGLVGSHLESRLVESTGFDQVVAVTRRPVEYTSEVIQDSHRLRS
ncbi:NAD-dependent epimerase/dehydratase family protein [Marinicella rhabdoformis]|uniref:NAD-dependent epimerase/dehydratase family protein n=1 Tax=Marinicella rhabdoformis TaxID=2580566 RepID=UPI0012AED69F|nr:NAD-dependent epimerase/dehydratase family protein [Marinicella rhabdoformis]